VIALFRYTFSILLHSQRYLPPTLVFLALLAILTSSDSGPILPVYAVSAGLVFVCSTWLTVTLINIEEPVSRAIVVVNARTSRKVLAAAVLVALAASLFLTVIGLYYPLVSGKHTLSATDLLIGTEAQLTCAFVGIAVGLLTSRLVIGRPGYSLVVALGLVLTLLLVKWIPPVHPLLSLLDGNRRAGDLLGPVTAFGAVGILVLLAGAAGTQYVSVRRD
jgi:hypothetical protein